MSRSGWAPAAGAMLLLATGCHRDAAPPPPPTTGALDNTTTQLDQDSEVGNDVTTVDLPNGVDPSYGATPMAQRVATIGLLNKRNGQSRDLQLHPGQAVRVGDVIVRLRACEETAPWEQDHYTGAFVQVDVRSPDDSWHRIFSGWLYKERPSLNVVQHPIYDVWTKACTMTFPVGGPNSVSVGAVPAGNGTMPPRSSAHRSPAAPSAAAGAAAPAMPDTAAANSN